FMRSFSQEHPRAGTALVDVGPVLDAAAARAMADRIAGLGRPPSGHHELGLGSSGMWTVELAPLPLEPLAEEPASGGRGSGVLDALTEPGAAVVVSGGTTGIVAHMLVRAAERTAGPLRGRLVLLSRTPAAEDGAEDGQEPVPPDKRAALLAWRRAGPGRSVHEFNDEWRRRSRAGETRRTLSRLATAGVEAEHHLVDVGAERDVRALAERLRAEHLAIRTIVHGAGIERSSRITDKPAAEWAETAAVKIMGFHHLVDIAGDALRLVVVHGSMLGSAAVPGQTDYAAANEYLSHAVARLRIERPGVTALYLGWPPWNKVGMAADAHTRRRLEERGARYIEPAEGDRWAAAAIADAAALPPSLVLLPTGGGSLAEVRVSRHDPPAERWWLVDTVLRKGDVTWVDRLYDVTDPRDAELADHRVRGRIRVSAAQVVEQLAEAFLCSLTRSPRAVELRHVRLRQGLVLSSGGRRPTRVVVERGGAGTGRTARDRQGPAADRAGLRLETTPMVSGDVPGPCQVVVATALAVAAESFPLPSDVVDVSALRPAGTPPGPGPLGRFGVEYSGRFAAPVTPSRHPHFAAAASVDPGPRPARSGRALTDIPTVDLAIRTILAVAPGNGGQGMPSSAERVVLDLRPRGGRARHVFVTVRPDGDYDVILTDEEGGMVMRIERLHLEMPVDHRR
ncbi:MAG TPA: SDR family NAD(P)-dependent oxidoreductase, partial [Streptosporangiaceae bacterium]